MVHLSQLGREVSNLISQIITNLGGTQLILQDALALPELSPARPPARPPRLAYQPFSAGASCALRWLD
jgi:hypothetical protein